MSRARNIKPGFFRNDLLAECDPLARILFAGLWCEADRAGRLEDRPKRIKAECLPYDDCDIEALLEQLSERGFIVRYQHGADRYIAIPKFAEHQNPHKNERDSSIPAPDKHSASTVQELCGPDTSTAPVSDKHSSNRADSLLLIPDSQTSSSTEVGRLLEGAGEKSTDRPTGTEPELPKPEPKPQAPTLAGEACLAMRRAGSGNTNPSHPALLAALGEGATPEMLADTVREGLAAGKGQPFTWAIATVRSRLAEAKQKPRAGPAPALSAVPSAASDFRGKSYAATDIDSLPPDMRDAVRAALAG